MSLIFLIGFIMMYTGQLSPADFNTDYFIIWGLFSIADALWIGRCSKWQTEKS